MQAPRYILRIAATLAAIGALALAGCASTTQDTDIAPAATAKPAVTASEPTATPEPQHEPQDAAARITSRSGDILFPDDFMSGEYRLVANAKIRNTGNVGVVIRVKATWDQSSDQNITMTKIVRLRSGASRTVKFTTPATQSQVSQFQSSPGYMSVDSEAWHVHARIIDTFGTTPMEES